MTTETLENPHFVLVHGAGHGAWCWYKISCLMESSGYKITCLDLKSAGLDPSDPNTVLTFDDYNKPLIDFLSNLPHDKKVILVGHSAGGLSLTDVIHRAPGKIHVAIYVAANMLKYGLSTDEDAKLILNAICSNFLCQPDLSRYGDENILEYAMGRDQPPTSVILKKEFQREILCQMSPQEDSTLASMLLKPAPKMAYQGAKFKGGGESDSVPRVYIKN